MKEKQKDFNLGESRLNKLNLTLFPPWLKTWLAEIENPKKKHVFFEVMQTIYISNLLQ